MRPPLPLASCLVALTVSTTGFGQVVANSRVRVEVLSSGGAATGFRVLAADREVARVDLCDQGLIRADRTSVKGSTITFLSLSSSAGVRFAKSSTIEVSLGVDDPYPRISFDLKLDAFDPAVWQGADPKSPFHFLCLPLREAQTFHTRGWLNATPLDDPFALLQDVHAGTPEISAYLFNRRWSNLVPLGAQPLPVIGLWAPERGRYVGFEFESTRLLDNSERDIATGYYWGGPPDGSHGEPADQFACLVYPSGGQGFQHLAFPSAGTRLASRCTLLWSTELHADGDPNEFVYSVIWPRMKDRLPRVPAGVDLSWLPGDDRLADFPPPPSQFLGQGGGPFHVPGTRLINGWKWQFENPVVTASLNGDAKQLDRFRAEGDELLKLAKHFRVGSDECVFWVNPLTGSWTDDWGGAPVASLHNAVGFAAGRLFLGLSQATHRPEYTQMAEGVLNWAGHIAWTRNEYPDVPSSPFAIGGALTSSFCLEYYAIHREDQSPVERFRAREALRLARSFAYRYLTMWPSDNDRFDGLDSTFLWEPNSGRDWTGAACANEVFQMLDSLAQVAVTTGDEVLMWALQGALSRWSVLYQNRYRDRLADYRRSDMAEGYGLYPGNVYGEGQRSSYGFADTLQMIEPVGSCEVRVLAGEGSAMVFDKHGVHSGIREYRFDSPGNFSFVMRSLKQTVDLTVTEPYADLSSSPVTVVRDGQRVTVEVVRPPQAKWSLIVKGVGGADTVTIGRPRSPGRPLASIPPLTQGMKGVWIPPDQAGFQCLAVPYDSFPDMKWDDLDSWAGLPRGEIWSYGVPFALPPNGGRSIVTKPIRFDPPVRAGFVAVAYSAADGPTPSIILDDGTRKPVGVGDESLVWQGWPPIYTRMLLSSIVATSGRRVVGVDPGARQVWAVSVATGPGLTAQVLEARRNGAKEWTERSALLARIDRLRSVAATADLERIAFLPPEPVGPIDTLSHQIGMGGKASVLTGNDLIGPDFTPARYPVVLATDSEDYIATVRSEGDAADAIRRYLDAGGTLVLATSGPFPMFYAMGPNGRTVTDPLPPKLGMPIRIPFGSPPDDDLRVLIRSGLPAGFEGIKGTLGFPEGDPRLRSIDPSAILPRARYVPIATVTGKSGKSYGDAAGMVVLPTGGRILYVWSGLLTDATVGFDFSEAVLRFVLQASKPSGR